MAVGPKKEPTESEKKEKEPLTPKRFLNLFKFYVLPVISVIIFFVIIIFGLYPTFLDLFSRLNHIDELSKESQALNVRIATFQDLRTHGIRTQGYLTLIESIVPSRQTEVVNFQQKIKKLAEDQQLRVDQPTTGESIITPTKGSLGLIEVPSKFTVIGELDKIKTFLAELDKGEDFLVINQMKLTRLDEGDWELKVTFVKYQFQQQTGVDEIFLKVPETSQPDKDVLEFIKDRYGKGDTILEFEDQLSTQTGN